MYGYLGLHQQIYVEIVAKIMPYLEDTIYGSLECLELAPRLLPKQKNLFFTNRWRLF